MITKKLFSILLMIMLLLVPLAGCGSPAASDNESSDTTYEEEQSEETVPENAVKARVELDEYQFFADSPKDIVVTGVINKSFGQDIIVLRGNKEVARITLEGNDGEEEYFDITVPSQAITDVHNTFQIKGGEISGVVDETNTKTFTINLPDNE